MAFTVRAVVFDLDGTLADTIGDIAAAANRALESLGRPPLPESAILGGVGRGVRHLMEACLSGAGPEDVTRACADFERFYTEAPADRTTLYPDAAEALEAIGPDAVLSVLSNKPTRFCRTILRALGLAERFAIVLGEDAVEAPKPDPRGLRGIVAALGVAPAEALYVGDSPVDVETGRAAGVPVAAVVRGYAPAEAVRAAAPDLLLDDLRGLPAALRRAA